MKKSRGVDVYFFKDENPYEKGNSDGHFLEHNPLPPKPKEPAIFHWFREIETKSVPEFSHPPFLK